MAITVKKNINNNIKSPWTYIGIDIDFNIHLTRKVLSEKYNPDLEKIEFFTSKLNGCQLFTHDNYKNSIFYIKIINGKKEILMEKDESDKVFYIKYSGFWEVFQGKFCMQYADVQLFTRIQLEDLLNSKGYKTIFEDGWNFNLLEDLLNSKGYKTTGRIIRINKKLEDLLNSKGYKTVPLTFGGRVSLEDLLNSKGYKTPKLLIKF